MARKIRESIRPPASPANPIGQVAILNLKGSSEFKSWFVGLSKHTHITPTTLVRLGLAKLAKDFGYPPPPEK